MLFKRTPRFPRKLIVGLGNPGSRYTGTRHNVGFLALAKVLLPEFHLKFKRKLWGGSLASAEIGKHEVFFLMPETYMNRSGEVVSAFLKRTPVSLENILVIHDDVDLELGKIRFRTSGSSGGHRGVESLIQKLSSEHFNRLRIGIGRPPVGVEVSDHVLEDFAAKEKKVLPGIFESLGEVVKAWIFEGTPKKRDF